MHQQRKTVNGIPSMGLGTWLRSGEDGFRSIMAGIELGYRHFDTAQSYGTEENVGRAIRESGLPRDAAFVVTKVAEGNLTRARFLPSVRESLEAMRLDWIDLLLIHWPAYRDEVAFDDYMGALAEAKALGLTSLIGVSNFTIPLIEKSVALLGPGEIATNQVELHPYLQSRRLAAACRQHGVSLTAYMPLARGKVLDDAVVARIGASHGVSATTVALAWLLQKDIIVIPASGRREHMAANFTALDVELTDAEMAAIDALDRGHRMIDPAKAPAWDEPA